MKYVTPEISWHSDREPIYGVDLQPTQPGDISRLASCGGDRFVRLWEVTLDAGKPTVSFLSSLNRHTRTVNAVRFCPDGTVLASGGDDSVIILWKKNVMVPTSNNIFSEDDEECREVWSVYKVLRSHLEDVYDICWSSDGSRLISGSIDNTAILWDTNKGCRLSIFTEHRSFVQGVAYDPLSQYVATMSTDRSLRVFNIETKSCIHNVRSISLPSDEKTKPQRLFHDAKSFFRRLSFSPDGQLLVAPTGCLEVTEGSTVNATFVFVRANLTKPVLYLPVPVQGSTFAVRFCPVIFQLRSVSETSHRDRNGTVKRKENVDTREKEEQEEEEDGDCEMENGELTKGKSTDENCNNNNDRDAPCDMLFRLPYRMVFAVLSENSVIFYDTQQQQPFAFVSNIHYRQLTDLSWSSDARTLVVSSTDGYCTLISFEAGELGKPYEKQVDTLLGHTNQDCTGQIPAEKQKETSHTSNPASNNNMQNTTTKDQVSTTAATTTTKDQISTTTTATKLTSAVNVSNADNTSTSAPSTDNQQKPGAVSSAPKPRRIAVTTLSTAARSNKPSENGTPQSNVPKSAAPPVAKRRAALITLSSPSSATTQQPSAAVENSSDDATTTTHVFSVPKDVIKNDDSPLLSSEVKPSPATENMEDVESSNSSMLSTSLLPDEHNLHLVLEMSNDKCCEDRR